MNPTNNTSSEPRSSSMPVGVKSSGDPTGEINENPHKRIMRSDTTMQRPGGDHSLQSSSDPDKTQLQPVLNTSEFAPLSLKPIAPGQTIKPNTLADKFVLEKQSPPGEEDAVPKDLDTFVPESEKMIKYGLQQAKHTLAMSAELTLLLENEKKILDQITTRCKVFTQLKEENKQSTELWNVENQQRLSKCQTNLERLSNYPDDLNVDAEGFQGQIQQKILLELVHKTAEAASDISLQLSIENTIINDVDLSLSGLKKHSAVMQRLIGRWTRMLNTHDQHQEEIVDRWAKIRQNLKELKGKGNSLNETVGGEMTNQHIISIVNDYGDRIRKLEETYNELQSSFSK